MFNYYYFMVLGLNPELCAYITLTLTPNCHIIEVTNVSTKYHIHWIDEPRFSSLLEMEMGPVWQAASSQQHLLGQGCRPSL